MKVIVASFQYESCGAARVLPNEEDFEYFSGNGIFEKLVVKEELQKNDFEVIPSIYVNALPGGILPLKLYNYYKTQILQTVIDNKDAVGIYIYVHGSMEVEKIGSGELQLIKEIRNIIGHNALIALSMDLHANIHEDLIPMVDIVCGYKTAPHTDQNETQLRTINILISCLKNKIKPKTEIVKVPMLIAGDTMLTDYDPLKLLEEMSKKAENNDIYAVNLFFAHMWVNAINTMACVVVTAKDSVSAQKTSKLFAKKFWNIRKDFKFLVEIGSLQECFNKALANEKTRVFISDSGDNTTAGAEGDKNDFLKYAISNDKDKKICIAGIANKKLIEKCKKLKLGDCFKLLNCNFKIKQKGKILGWAKEIIGDCITLSYNNVDAIFTEKRSAFICKDNFDFAGVNLFDYNIVVVKLGYLFAELKPYADEHYFAFTEGSSCVDIFRLKLNNIKRPMYPLDKDFDYNINNY